MISPWIGIISVLFALGAIFVGLKLYGKKYGLKPEFSRKAVHILLGCITLSFPWVFREPWAVLVLGILALAALLSIRLMKVLKNSLGSVLYSVSRDSLGEIYFPISVVVLFFLSHGNKVFYAIPILMLTFADSTAALIGSSYGRKNLAVEKEDIKSLEGTVVFFIVAFISTLVPILLFTSIGRAEALLLSLIMGILAALIEVVSYNGNDNLLVPLLGYAFLIIHANLSVEKLLASFLVIAGLAIFAFFWNKRASLSRLGVITGLLGVYLIVILGGWMWAFPPLILFVTYSILPSLNEFEKKQVMNHHIVTTNIAAGLVWVWLAAVTGLDELFFYGFVGTFAFHLGMNTYIRLNYNNNYTESRSVLVSFIKSAVFIVLPGIILNYYAYGHIIDMKFIFILLISLLLSILAVVKLKKYTHYEIVDTKSGWINTGIALILSSTMIFVKYLIG